MPKFGVKIMLHFLDVLHSDIVQNYSRENLKKVIEIFMVGIQWQENAWTRSRTIYYLVVNISARSRIWKGLETFCFLCPASGFIS